MPTKTTKKAANERGVAAREMAVAANALAVALERARANVNADMKLHVDRMAAIVRETAKTSADGKTLALEHLTKIEREHDRLASIVETRLQKIETDMLALQRDTEKARARAVGERVFEAIEYLGSVNAQKGGRFLVLGSCGRQHAYVTVELDTAGIGKD